MCKVNLGFQELLRRPRAGTRGGAAQARGARHLHSSSLQVLALHPLGVCALPLRCLPVQMGLSEGPGEGAAQPWAGQLAEPWGCPGLGRKVEGPELAALAKEGCRSEAEPHWSSLKLCPSPELWDGERAASGVSGTEQMAKLTLPCSTLATCSGAAGPLPAIHATPRCRLCRWPAPSLSAKQRQENAVSRAPESFSCIRWSVSGAARDRVAWPKPWGTA